MIRLMIIGATESLGREVSARLRGGTIVGCLDPGQSLAPTGHCDAAVFVGAQCPDRDSVTCCLDGGKHVLLATHSLPADTAFLRKQDKTSLAPPKGAQLAIWNPDHYLPSRRLIRQQLDAGKLGDVGLVRIHRWQPAAMAGLPRDLEMAEWLTGKTPNSVYAVAASKESAGRSLLIHLGFPGRAMALIDCSEQSPEIAGYHALSVIGAAGAAYADDQQNMQLLFRAGVSEALSSGEGIKPLVGMIQEFIDALEAGADLSASVAAWGRALLVTAAVERSLESGRALSMEER